MKRWKKERNSKKEKVIRFAQFVIQLQLGCVCMCVQSEMHFSFPQMFFLSVIQLTDNFLKVLVALLLTFLDVSAFVSPTKWKQPKQQHTHPLTQKNKEGTKKHKGKCIVYLCIRGACLWIYKIVCPIKTKGIPKYKKENSMLFPIAII